LKAFKEAHHGHLRVTSTLDKKLAAFCSRMRKARQKPDATGISITEEKIKALDVIKLALPIQTCDRLYRQ